jgi:hypothetical protein
MVLVIDANVFEGFFKEEILGIDEIQLTASPKRIFERLGQLDVTYFDTDGHIKNEWRQLVEPEWFDGWYPKLLIEGGAFEIGVQTYYQIRKQLKTLGFPSSKDIWYIRTAKSIGADRDPTIITEDLDFFNPRMKKCCNKTRIEILKRSCGPIEKYLSKKESICVNSVITYLNRTGC